MKRPIVYTNVPAWVSKTWRENTRLIKGTHDTANITDPHVSGPSRMHALRAAWKLFRHRQETECFVTTGDLTGLTLALLQSLFPLGKKPHLIMSAIWTYPRNRLELMARRLLLPFAYWSVTDTFVNVTREIDAYSQLFGIPQKKFSFLPYCYRLKGYDYEIDDNGYIWSGGNGNRDYGLLVEAVRDIERPVIINSTRESLFKGLNIPEHVKIQGVTPAEFRQSMAGCSLGVIPMVGNKLHSGGQQTFLGLMKMGKPVILTDPDGGKDYIKSGYNGILVPFGDVEQLKDAILFLLRNPDKAKEMGRRAAASVRNNSEDDYMRAVWERACREAKIWRKRNTHGQAHHRQA